MYKRQDLNYSSIRPKVLDDHCVPTSHKNSFFFNLAFVAMEVSKFSLKTRRVTIFRRTAGPWSKLPVLTARRIVRTHD